MNTTAVYFHNLFNKKVWDIINNKFQNFPEKMKEELALDNVLLKEPPLASEELLLKVHTKNYFRRLKERWDYTGARYTVGGCADAAERIMAGEYHNALCFGVAAGHHAEKDSAWGGTYASVSGGIIANLEEKIGDFKLAILDTDSHHGNGTRDVTFGKHNILHVCFCSSNIIQDEGTKICVDSGYRTTDEDYISKVKSEFISRIEKFKPELIVHLLGHDTAKGDYGSRGLSKDFFLDLVKLVKNKAEEICEGRYLINTHGGSNRSICEYIHPRIIRILSDNY
ncbi:MAG: hypothetical protein EU551_02680 [Promethearchaeota archaeon]|nr:MAG: hypothetical protein EU551_02680 [Candidatus Lokiarchaeota archaeon]